MASHQTIWEYAPRSRAAEDYTELIDFIGDSGSTRGEHHVSHERIAARPITGAAASPA
jgi:hypothetical protein